MHLLRAAGTRSPIGTMLTGKPTACLLAGLIGLSIGGCAHTSATHERVEPTPPHLRPADSRDEPRGAAMPASGVALPNPETTQDVTLPAMLAFADARSPVLAVARSTRSRAEAAHVAASAALPANPELSVAAGPRMGNGPMGVDFAAALSQRFEIAGERGLRLDAADRLAELTDAEIEQIRWSVHCDVHAAFHEALVARERDQLGGRVLAFQEELLRIVERQIAAGEAAPLMLRLAQAEVAQARQTAVAAAQAHYAARLTLAQLSGWPADRPPTPVGTVDAPRDPPELAALVAMARERLPLLAARKAAVREAEARAVAADREAWTQPALGVQYNREGNRGPEGPNHIVLGSLSFALPAVQRNQGERARARADLQVARAELDAAQALLAGSIARARSEVAAAAERVRSYGSEVIPRLEENLTLLRRSYELGDIDLLALSIGRERFLRIQSDAFVAHLDYFVALAALERAAGADLWSDERHEEHVP